MIYKLQITYYKKCTKRNVIDTKRRCIKNKNKILKIGEDPRLVGAIKLKGRTGWRVRVGHFRIIYEINDELNEVLIVHIGHRRDIYNL